MAMKNHKRISVPRLLTPVALAITLAACSSQPKTPLSVDITQDPVKSAQSYIMQADSSQGSLQNDWLIMALKASVEANDVEQANRLINRLSKQSLSPLQQAEWQLARANLVKNAGDYDLALSKLNFQSNWSLPDEQWQEYHQLRSDLFALQSRYFEAANELSNLSQYEREQKQPLLSEGIWEYLSYDVTPETARLVQASSTSTFAGWVELSQISKQYATSIAQLKGEIEEWLLANPNHPAALYTPNKVQDILALDIAKPVNTALLLPLTGRFAKQAQLIRDGFIMEMMNDEERDDSATLTIVDTNINDAKAIETLMLEKDIDFVVGPLTKDKVEELQTALDNLQKPIPTLALNIPDTLEAGTDTCYLALSPEQEVAQAAKHFFEQGYQYPLVLAPQGSLGQRVVEAFNEEWAKHSDNKVAVNLFGDKRQLQRNINGVFGLQDSQQHIAQMEALLDIPLESQPRSRRDIDAVYIVAKSSELTLIKPFIEVAINPDTIPPKLFSNSRSNSSSKQYEDLTGVTYSDIPLLIQPDAALEAEMAQLWPRNSNAEKRLQALGMDAYQLMEQLPQMKVVEGYSIEGKTGVLTIDEQCVVQREISWAEREAL